MPDKKIPEEVGEFDDFTERQRLFVAYYLGDKEHDTYDTKFNVKNSGLAAGYCESYASKVYSAQHTAHIRNYIEKEIKRRTPKSDALLKELTDIAFDSNTQPRDKINAIKETLKFMEKTENKIEVRHKFDSKKIESLLGIDLEDDDE